MAEEKRPQTPPRLTDIILPPIDNQQAYEAAVEPVPLLTALAAAPRASAITEAVVGTSLLAPSIHTMPPEILLKTFGMLDPRSLCRLAQVSMSCRALADDSLVWREVCGFPSSAATNGLYKERERMRYLRALALQAEQRAREEEERKVRRRRWKRRLLNGVFALCGVVLALRALLPALSSLLGKRPIGGGEGGGQRALTSASLSAPLAPALPPPKELRYDALIWEAATVRA
uniref:F-box domain-containing protein n=1 Tax=Prymnesium polylepis TaxID=72548 RepID=A0A7S4HD00_9EUKA